MVTTRVKDVLWYCVICERVVEGKANDEVRVCEGNVVRWESGGTSGAATTGEGPLAFHVPIEMEAR